MIRICLGNGKLTTDFNDITKVIAGHAYGDDSHSHIITMFESKKE